MFKNLTIFTSLLLFFTGTVCGQNFWQPLSEIQSNLPAENRRIIPDRFQAFQLEFDNLQDFLEAAPLENEREDSKSSFTLNLPTPKGTTEKFQVWESSIMHPDLANRYPEIRTFAGRSLENPYATVRFDYTMHGFHAMVNAPDGSWFVDPYAFQDTENYISYYKKDFVANKNADCSFADLEGADLPTDDSSIIQEEATEKSNRAYCSQPVQLRTYRAAVACTGEYGSFHGTTVAEALAAIVTTMNRVNSVYERDLAIRLTLIANNDEIVFVNPLTDPFQNNNNSIGLLFESQVVIDFFIGDANYDIGHTVSTGAGGVASLGVICQSNSKARGVTGTNNPVGDPFDIDYVSHEMGHQFGGNHTFNGTTGSCGGGNRNASTAFEPGSGATIQAYAGICGAQNLQRNSDAYFHVGSLDEMIDYSRNRNGNSCPTFMDVGSTSPAILSATTGFTIPASTPFELTGVATDAENDAITYCWEQYDAGNSDSIDDPNAVSGAIFRSYFPTPDPVRTFPRMVDLLNNTDTIGEVLPAVSRDLNFRLTIRDNGTGSNNIGGVCFQDYAISVSDAAGPFLVETPNTEVTWNGGSTETVTWDAAGTASAPINCANVDILLSTDGGNTYASTLASGVPNNGSADVSVPTINTDLARIKVICSDNIFFDISNDTFNIVTALALEWAAFGAKPLATAIQLDWSTVAETDNAYFEIERRSESAIDFMKIGQQIATNKSTATYQFLDNKVQPNTLYYYRLRLVGKDGRAEYSKIVTAQLMASDILEVDVFPNPALDNIEIQFLGNKSNNSKVEIINLTGQLMLSSITNGAKSELSIRNLDSGIYMLKIWNADQQVVKRFVKQ